jgi:hypothetical protein
VFRQFGSRNHQPQYPPFILRKGTAMKTLSGALLLMALFAFVLMGCSDNSSSPADIGEQTVAASAATGSLAKRGPVVASVTGNGAVKYDFWLDGKQVFGSYAVSARMYADGSCDGEYQIIDHVVSWKSTNSWHGKVLSLKIDGNKALVGGQEVSFAGNGDEVNLNWYDAFVLVDNGQGSGATSPDMRSMVYVEPPENYLHMKNDVWTMTPDNFITFEEATYGFSLFTVTQGNIQVWQAK